jgi:hypothetical protein
MHAFWKETGEQQKQAQMAGFMKNTALLGGALVLFSAWNQLQATRVCRSRIPCSAAGEPNRFI